MLCPNCGTELPDGSQFCSGCGSAIGRRQVLKKDFVKTYAPEPTMKKIKLAKLMSIVCVLLMLVSYLVVINTSVEKIPMIAPFMAMEDDSIDYAKEGMEEYAEMLEEIFDEHEDELEDELTKAEIRKLKKLQKVVEKCSKSLSIANINSLANVIEDLAEIDEIEDMLRYTNTFDDLIILKSALGFVTFLFFVGALGNALFLFFGGFYHKTALIVVGTVFSALFCLTSCGVVMLLFVLAANIFSIVLSKQIDDAYVAYYKGM